MEQVAHCVDASTLLVVGLDDSPRRNLKVGEQEHSLFRFGVFLPLVLGHYVYGAHLPLLERIRGALLEAPELLALAHGEVELDQVYAAVHNHALQQRHMLHKEPVLRIGGEAHNALNAGAVVPRAVEQHDFARCGEVADVALKVPLPGFHVGRLVERDNMRAAGVPVFHKAGDGAALAGGVPPLEQDNQPIARFLHPVLELDQLYLQGQLFGVVFPVAHPGCVGIEVIPEIANALPGGYVQRIVQRRGVRDRLGPRGARLRHRLDRTIRMQVVFGYELRFYHKSRPLMMLSDLQTDDLCMIARRGNRRMRAASRSRNARDTPP